MAKWALHLRLSKPYTNACLHWHCWLKVFALINFAVHTFWYAIHPLQFCPIHLLNTWKEPMPPCVTVWCQASSGFLILLWPLVIFPPRKDCGQRESRKQFGSQKPWITIKDWLHRVFWDSEGPMRKHKIKDESKGRTSQIVPSSFF